MFNEKISFSVSDLPIRVSKDIVEHSKNDTFPIHYHDEFEFLLMARGSMKCTTTEQEYVLREGDVIFINGRIPHMTEILEDKTIYHLLNISMPSSGKGPLRYITKFLKTSDSPCYHFVNGTEENKEIYSYIMSIYKENKEKNNAYEFYMGANMYMILALLHRINVLCDESHMGDRKAVEKITPVIEYIDENYAEPLTLEKLSEMLNFDKSYFCRIFKKATGSTLTEYLNFVRICKSEKLLKEGNNVSEAAYAVGFSSLSYYNRTFKKYKRCSPSTYRKIMSERKKYGYIER